MISCQRCGQPLTPNTPTCPRCGAPVTPSAGWSQPQPGAMGASPFGAGPFSPYGGPPSPSLAFGPAGPAGPAGGAGGQQPPRFSAGSLISDGDLPEWLRQETAGPSVGQQAPWGGPAQPAQSWQQPQQPQQQDIAALHTVRQPAVGAPNPAPAPYPQQPAFAPQPVPAPYPQPQPGYPQGPQAGYQQGYPPAPYPQQPAPANYGGYGRPPTPPPPTPINAFPGIEQAGTAYNGPQGGGMAAQALLNQQALPNWLAGAQPGLGQAARGPAPSGMQARSLVDDQALPKWLRDQPDHANQPGLAERQNVSEWIGASAAQEPMPQFLNEAYAQAQIARAPQPGLSAFGAAPASALGQPAAPYAPPFSSPYGAPAGGAVSPANPGSPGDDGAMPAWLRAQAGAAPAGAGARDGAGGFSASDLIDPSSLPAWVSGKAPVEQVFSSTHGWSAANPDSPSAFATSDQGTERGMGQGGNQGYAEQGYEQGFDQSFDQAFGQDYDQGYDQGYDQSQQGDAGYADFGGDESAQPAWGEAQLDAASPAYGDDDSPHGRRGQRRAQRDGRHAQAQPLAPDELPPWLRGKAGAPGASAHMPAAQRNPWASAAEPMETWEEAEPWSAQQDAPAEQGWGADASQWGGSDDQRSDQRGAQRDGWGYEEPPAGWGEQPSDRRHHGRSAERRRDGWDDDPAYSSGAHAGYTDERYASRYDRSRDGYGDYGEYDEDGEYADDPSDRKRGRGWLGFMRRDKR